MKRKNNKIWVTIPLLFVPAVMLLLFAIAIALRKNIATSTGCMVVIEFSVSCIGWLPAISTIVHNVTLKSKPALYYLISLFITFTSVCGFYYLLKYEPDFSSDFSRESVIFFILEALPCVSLYGISILNQYKTWASNILAVIAVVAMPYFTRLCLVVPHGISSGIPEVMFCISTPFYYVALLHLIIPSIATQIKEFNKRRSQIET